MRKFWQIIGEIFTQTVAILAIVAVSIFLGANFGYYYGLKGSVPKTVMSFLRDTKKLAQTPVARSESFYVGKDQGPSEIFRKENVEYPFTFIVYGDTQEPRGFEKGILIKKVIEENPLFVAQTGDKVVNGEKPDWDLFDKTEARIMEQGIAYYPALGNHEYYTSKRPSPSNPDKQLGMYFGRFKHLKQKHWYSFTYGNCTFIILDTNMDHEPGSYQYEWLVDKLENNISEFVFIGFHHPPYTKSVGHSARSSEKELAKLFESYKEKGLAKVNGVFSGHCHNYERYRHNGINYIISGNAGAPPKKVERDPGDFYTDPGYTVGFCKITVWEDRADFEMMKLDEYTGEWSLADSFTIYADDDTKDSASLSITPSFIYLSA